MRTFRLERTHDVSGVSGTGHVADGVLFETGQCVVCWRGERPSIVIWPSLDDAHAVHSHGGATRFVFDDEHDRFGEMQPIGDHVLHSTLVACDSILSLLHHRGIVDSDDNRRDVEQALAAVRRYTR